MPLTVEALLSIHDASDYKVHLACWNGEYQPLDVFVRDRAEWHQWNTWRSSKDEFNRPYILALIDFYPQANTWLFGGIYKVIARTPTKRSHSYTVEYVAEHEDLVGRLKIGLRRPGRIRAVRLENYIDRMIVHEVLREAYTGERFPGYENINHDFSLLETVFRTQRPDWKAALESVKGVYLVADKSNGKKYVGSAYGDLGLWARWSSYVGTGHGWSDELTKVIQDEGLDYARHNFRITLLEYRPARTDDRLILERETFWKEALVTRGRFGYNQN